MEEGLKKLFLEIVKFSKEVSPEVWAILLKQQIIWGLLSVALTILGWLGTGLFYAKYQSTRDSYKGHEVNPFEVACVALGAVTVIGTIAVCLEGLPRILNPAYYALMALKP